MLETQKIKVREALRAVGLSSEVYEEDFDMVGLYKPHGEGGPDFAITLANIQAAAEEARYYTRLDLGRDQYKITNAQAQKVEEALKAAGIPCLDETESDRARRTLRF
jgi:hypothetical protein